ncbi:MAG: hypothetical protein IJB73_09545 [Firmicutes bacterium]|nr:hypothetical protein [Bacillota bacterium]
MNDIKQCLHVMGENQTLQIDFAGTEQTEKEIEPGQLKEALQQMQPGETLIVRFDNEES